MLSSRERLLKCIRHEPVDRVPISTYEMVGWDEDCWENKQPSYKRLMEAVKKYTDCIYMMEPNYVGEFCPALETQKWKAGESSFTKSVYNTNDGQLTMLERKDDNINTTWTLKHLLDDISDIEKYLSIPYIPPVVDFTRFYKQQEELGDKGIMMISVSDPICEAAFLFGMDLFLEYAITEEERISYFLDIIHERQMHIFRSITKHDLKDVMIRIYGPEYATPPYLSPAYFDKYVMKYLTAMCSEIKNAGAIPRIHSHGKIARVLDRFAETDAEVLEPIEPLPDGDITLKEVKERYGKRFCLMGNIELRELEISDRNRIDSLVKQTMEEAKEGSGFILMHTAAPINAPLSKKTEENYLQMFESAHRYGGY